jgi:hypothetical protein
MMLTIEKNSENVSLYASGASIRDWIDGNFH